MDNLVLYIAKKSGLSELNTSTRRISIDIAASQQTISRRLRALESLGLIERYSTPSGVKIKLTSRAVFILKGEYSALRSLFEKTSSIKGKVLPGMGEGGYYIRVYAKKLASKLGFEPYPGTLNVAVDPLEKEAFVLDLERIDIPEFKTKTRTFGTVHCYKIRINNSVDGALIIPVRSRHPGNVAELIAPIELRKKFNLKDDSELVLEKPEGGQR